MKRTIVYLLLAVMLLSACGRAKKEETSASSDEASVSEVTPEPTAEPTPEPTAEPTLEPTPEPTPEPTKEPTPLPVDTSPTEVAFDPDWEFGYESLVNTGTAVLYKAAENRRDIVIGVNAGHGCDGGSYVYTYCHPDHTPKITGGSTAEGAIQAMSSSVGMTFFDGTPERDITLAEARILRDLLLEHGYDVLMIRDGEDVQLDNIARTLLCNNYADCHIAIHWDGDGLDYDKGAFYMSVPEGLKGMYPVSETWEGSDHLGDCLIQGLQKNNCPIFSGGSMPVDLTQTSYSKVPSVDIELGNAASDHSDAVLAQLAKGLLDGIDLFFGTGEQ